MFQGFSNNFNLDIKKSFSEEDDLYKGLSNELFELLTSFGGSSIHNGLYRIHTCKSSQHWSLLISEYFRGYKLKIYPFGFDWMGRQFCSDKTNNIIFMFDPATGEDFELKQNLLVFHNESLVDDTDNILAVALFEKVLSHYKEKNVKYEECFGYKIPLFLGGEDKIDNYEKQDIEVYWNVESQLFKQTRDLRDGTRIDNIRIEKNDL